MATSVTMSKGRCQVQTLKFPQAIRLSSQRAVICQEARQASPSVSIAMTARTLLVWCAIWFFAAWDRLLADIKADSERISSR
jgi:hypothetical protein